MDCKNCNKQLNDTQKFCDECGAKVIQNRLTPRVLAHQVNEQFISIDNKFLRTFIDLFTKPGEVIDGYINGTRKKYIDVLQYFAISLTLAGIQVFLMTTFFKDALDLDSSFMGNLENMPGQDKNPMKDFNFDFISNYQGIIYIASVPLAGFSSWIVYFMLDNKRYNFTEHLVLNLYYSAQIIIVTSIFSILFLIFGFNYLLISSLIMIPATIYLGYILKDVFKETHWETFSKFLPMMIIYGILYFVVMLIFVITKVIIDLNNGSV